MAYFGFSYCPFVVVVVAVVGAIVVVVVVAVVGAIVVVVFIVFV